MGKFFSQVRRQICGSDFKVNLSSVRKIGFHFTASICIPTEIENPT